MTHWAAAYDVVIFDLDGTLFRGRVPIPCAADAVSTLRRFVECRFLSNNGGRLGSSLSERLRGLGFEVRSEEVISSADIVLECLSRVRTNSRILALTSVELTDALKRRGFQVVDNEHADVVIVGVDRMLTRERMVRGLRACLAGAKLVATNEDPTYPGDDGLRPAAGAYVGFFRGMGFTPNWFCGKPDNWAVRTALRAWGIADLGKCLFVGDNLKTDIEAARRVGADSALVLTGVSQVRDLQTSRVKPTYVVSSVAELVHDQPVRSS